MNAIHYLNFTAQSFSAAADIITLTSTESAGLLRSLSSARHVHAAQLWAIAGQVRKGDALDGHKEYYPNWNFTMMPPAIGAGMELSQVVDALRATIQTEIALQSTKFTISWTNQNPIFYGVINASKLVAVILELVITRIDSDQAKTWVCTNCYNFFPDKIPDACDLCGVGRNWFKPYARI